jgi:hypothetical protein
MTTHYIVHKQYCSWINHRTSKSCKLLSATRSLSLPLGIGILLRRCLRSAHVLKLLLPLLLIRSNTPFFTSSLCSFSAASSLRLFSNISRRSASHSFSPFRSHLSDSLSQCQSTAQNHRAVEGSATKAIVIKQINMQNFIWHKIINKH